MKTGFENLNLRPFEKRLLAVIGIVLFVILNFWLVFPHFSDWGRLQEQKWNAERKLRVYQNEILQIPELEAKVKQFEGEARGIPAGGPGHRFPACH